LSDLLQRGAEQARLEAAVARATAGDGGLVLIDGPAGIGKTALLRHARMLAEGAGMRVLSAVASELDRAFPYGLVHQLLEGEVAGIDASARGRLFAGAATHAEVVFDLGSAAATGEPGHAVLHGLYWLCANLSDEQPIAMLIDDLHWGDRASLRFVEYLGRRLEGVPLLIVGTTRIGEPGAEEDLLQMVASSPDLVSVALGPLAPDAARELIERWLGAAPQDAFLEACLTATGGNPLLLHALGREAREHGLRGVGSEAAQVTALSGTTVVAGLQRRLRGLGPDATAVALAAAVLGARRGIADLEAVAGLDRDATRGAVDVLTAAGILLPGGLTFTHPLVRRAVVGGATPTQLAQLHATAVARLTATGARPDELAVHLLEVAPSGDPAVVATLRRAADGAVAEGAPEAAVRQLRRALAEPPPATERPSLLLGLGELEQRTGEPQALDRLSEALAGGLEADDAARAHASRAAHLIGSDPRRALEELSSALGVVQDPDLRLRLESGLLDSTAYLASLVDRRRELLDAGRADAHPSPAMLAHLAQDAAYSGRPVEETLELVDRALADGRLMRVIGPVTATFHLLILTLRHAERPELARQLLDQGSEIVTRSGSRLGSTNNDHARAFWNMQFGSVAAAEAYARAAVETADHLQLPLPMLSTRIILSEVLLEQDRFAEVAPIVDGIPDAPSLDDVIIGADFLSVRAAVRAEQGRRAEAEADLRRAVRQIEVRGWRAPLKSRARLRLARLLAESSPGEARALAQHEVDTARGAGTPGALGASLRILARVVGGAAATELLREAVDVLDASPMRLERGWALHDLGSALRRDGSRVDAREPLRVALEIADQCEAPLLRRLVREELGAAGSRPRRSALSGIASLTPSERRVAELAAAGKTNREIAEELWVTRKTVEVHLGKVYGKLGIRTRGELPGAFEATAGGEVAATT
jgi:DNA-binding CsgD family transcriptional regulator